MSEPSSPDPPTPPSPVSETPPSPPSPDYSSPVSDPAARQSPASSPFEPPPKRHATWRVQTHLGNPSRATRILWSREDDSDDNTTSVNSGQQEPEQFSRTSSDNSSSKNSSDSSDGDDSSSEESSSTDESGSSDGSSSRYTSSVSDSDGSSSDSDTDICSQAQKLYPGSDKTVDEAVYDVMNNYIEHSESQSSLASHLRTFVKYLPEPNYMPKTVPHLYRYLEKLDPSFKETTHTYCAKCLLLYLEEPNEDGACEVCGSQDRGVFYSFDIEQQIKHLMEKCGLAEELDKVIARRNSVTDNDNHSIRDITDGLEYKKLNVSGYDITLLWYTDGVRIGKGKRELWGLQYMICELPPHLRILYMGVCGLWVDSKKPLMNTFLAPFSESLKGINLKGGVKWTHPKTGEKRQSLVFGPIRCGDGPARAGYVNGQGHNAKRPCFTCEEKSVRVPLTVEELRAKQAGKRVRKKRGFVRGNARLRTHDRMKKHGIEAARKSEPVMGLKGPTCVENIPGVDLAKVTYSEYMHGVCLGVVRLFLSLWICVPGPWNIKGHLKEMDAFLGSVKPSRDVNRIIGPVSDYAKWKASECRQWLLFLSLPCLVNFLPEKYFQHWMLLVISIYLLLTEEISRNDLERADLMLRTFVRDVPILYRGSDCVYNVHQLLHYSLYVERGGPLWSTSAFPFENFNFVLVRMIHGTKNPGKELVNCLKRVHYLNILKNKVVARSVGLSAEIFPVNKVKRGVLSGRDKEFMLLKGVNVGDCKVFARVKRQRETFTSLCYTREKRRNNYTVSYYVNGQTRYGEIECYILLPDSNVAALISRFNVQHGRIFYHTQSEGRVTHLVPVESSVERDFCEFDKIIVKVMRVGDFICNVPNKFEKNL